MAGAQGGQDPCSLPRCAECGQPYTPFPIRESRLCAPCVYRTLTGCADLGERRRLLETAMRAAATGSEAVLHELVGALEALPAVRRCVLWSRAGERLECLHGARVAPAPPPTTALARLQGPVFVRDLAGVHPELARRLRGWTLVAPLRPGGRLLGALAVAERREPRLRRPGDLELLATVTAAASAALERQRLLRETTRLAEALARLERLDEAGALAASTAHEIHNTLVAVRTMLDGPREDAGRVRGLGLRHLRHALDLSQRLVAVIGPPGGTPGAAEIVVRAHCPPRPERHDTPRRTTRESAHRD